MVGRSMDGSWFLRADIQAPVVERERRIIFSGQPGDGVDEVLFQLRGRQRLEVRTVNHGRDELAVVRLGGKRGRRGLDTRIDLDEPGASGLFVSILVPVDRAADLSNAAAQQRLRLVLVGGGA